MHVKTRAAALAALLLPSLAAAGDLKPGALEVSGRSGFDLTRLHEEVTTREPGLPNVVDKADRSGAAGKLGALYYVTKNVGVGLELGYERRKEKIAPITTIESMLTVGPRVGLDVGVAESLSIFAEGSIVYASRHFEEKDALDPAANVSYESTGYGFGVAGGVKYFPVRALSLGVGVDYAWRSVKGHPEPGLEETRKTGAFGAFAGLSFYFGN